MTAGAASFHEARALGYRPQDDAEVHAAEVQGLVGEFDATRLDAAFC